MPQMRARGSINGGAPAGVAPSDSTSTLTFSNSRLISCRSSLIQCVEDAHEQAPGSGCVGSGFPWPFHDGSPGNPRRRSSLAVARPFPTTTLTRTGKQSDGAEVASIHQGSSGARRLGDRRRGHRGGHRGAGAGPVRSGRAVLRRSDPGRRTAAAQRAVPARHRSSGPGPPDTPPVRSPHVAVDRGGRQWGRRGRGHPARRHRRLRPGLGRRCHHALHRLDDGLSGLAPGHRARGHLHTVPVDRRHGDRAGELGADRTGHLHGNNHPGRTRVHRGGARPGRGLAPHPVPACPPPLDSDHSGLGDARDRNDGSSGGDPVVSRYRRSTADAFLGRDHLRKPVLFSDRAVAGVLSRHRDHGAGPGLQPGGRRLARCTRPDPTRRGR